MPVPFQLSFIASLVAAQSSNITYNVIASPPTADMSVAVIVDGSPYPLTAPATGDLLFSGSAPAAKSEYHYALLNSANQVNASEAFTRVPVLNESTTTNEFFNRSMSTHQLASLPQVYEPAPVIDRIDSNLHQLGQIPTIHIWGNQTAVDLLHENQLEDLEFELNLTYYG